MEIELEKHLPIGKEEFMKIVEKETLQRWLLLWGLGNLLVLLFLFPALILGCSGVVGIRIRGFLWAKISRKRHPHGVVGYYRHIGLLDGLILALAHWPRWLFGRKSLAFSFIADYWLERFPFLKQACIALPKDETSKGTKRHAAKEALRVVDGAQKLLDGGGMVYMAPSGSREKNCQHFKIRHGEKTIPRQTSTFLTYKSLRQACGDKLIAAFQPAGIGRLAQRTNAAFLPISIKRGRGWRRLFLEIKYGEVITISQEVRGDREAVVAHLEDELLAVVEKP